MAKATHLRATPDNTKKLKKVQELYKKRFPNVRPVSLDSIANMALEVGIDLVPEKLNCKPT